MGQASGIGRIIIKIVILGKGEARGEFHRFLAPNTINILLRSLPLSGRVHRFDSSFLYITSNVVAGVEKGRTVYKRGDLAFLPLNGAICFFLTDAQVRRPMNPLGRMTEGLTLLEGAQVGDTLRLEPL